MNQNTKKIIIAVVILILILAIIWIVYECFKPETIETDASNVLPNENTGIDNVTNDFIEDANMINEINDENANDIANKVVKEEQNTDKTGNKADNEKNNGNNGKQDSEKGHGTVKERKTRAVELAKEFYEDKYGNADELNFAYEALNGDGRYIVRAGKPGVGSNKFFYVDLDKEMVEEM